MEVESIVIPADHALWKRLSQICVIAPVDQIAAHRLAACASLQAELDELKAFKDRVLAQSGIVRATEGLTRLEQIEQTRALQAKCAAAERELAELKQKLKDANVE